MVNIFSIVCLSVSLFICVLLPAVFIIYLYKKEKISIKAVIVGALAFTISQPLIRIPILNYFNATWWFIEFSTIKWAYSLFLGLTAGLFEEVARFIGFKYFLKDKLEWKNGIAFGLGHGGIEALILVGPSVLTYLVDSIFINAGKFDSYALGKAPQAAVEAIKNSLINTTPLLFLMPGVERILAITAHIAMTMVVLYGVKNRKSIYLLYAILLHTLLDTPLGLSSNKYLIEVYIVIFAVVSFIFIIKSRKFAGFANNNESL